MKFINPNKFIKEKKFVPSKKLGQNFLINEDILNEIIMNIDIDNVDAIIEIGPGLGVLTSKLIELEKPLYLIELDKRLYDYLNERLSDKKNIQLFNENILDFDFSVITNKHKNPIIVANLPYSISSLIVIKFLKTLNIKTMYCMLQQEVAQRLIAKPKTKQYNSFSVLFQHQATCSELIHVCKNCFNPAPEVESKFIKLEKHSDDFNSSYDKFLKLIFLSKRKTLKNNLKHTIYNEKIEYLFNKFNLDEKVRSEEIPESIIYQMFLNLNNHV